MRPTAAKIGTASQTMVASRSAIGVTQANKSVDEGMLIAAPASGGTSRRPNCVNTSARPNRKAAPKASAMLITRRRLARLQSLAPSFSNPRKRIPARQPAMATHKLLLLPGDGIGPEVMAEVKKLIGFVNSHGMGRFESEEGLVGGCCYDAHKVAITDATMAKAHAADAVIFGAVGGPKWDGVPYDARPEAGLLRLRKELGLFANIRPAICYPALADASSLKRDVVDGLDIIILRELTGGVYFGEPKTITDLGNGQKRAIDTQVYDTYEIERISRVAFELARKRRNKVTSMEKRNVMKTGVP